MSPNQLRTFLTVATSGSIRAAAEKLTVSQPAISSVVNDLEKELKVKLFTKEGRGIKITPSGIVLVQYAKEILGLLEEASSAVRSSADPQSGPLRLAAVTTAGENLVPRYLSSFRSHYRGVEIALEVGNRQRVWEALADRSVDLAIGGKPPAIGKYVTLAIKENELVVVAAATEGQKERAVSLEDLRKQTWLMREPGSGTRATSEELFEQLGINPPVLTLGSNGAIRESVRIGLGITLISSDAVAHYLNEASLEKWIYGPLPLKRKWHLVARNDEKRSETAKLFIEHITNVHEITNFASFELIEPIIW